MGGRVMTRLTRLFVVMVLAAGVSGCTALDALRLIVQPPSFSEVEGQPAEIRLLGPSSSRPAGGAAIRLWTRVSNPNQFSLTLRRLEGTLELQGSRAATVDFPLGLPLTAGEATVIPLDLSVSFADLPGLGDAIRRAVSGQPIDYALDGTVAVEAGRFGTPTFGPMRLLDGEVRVR